MKKPEVQASASALSYLEIGNVNATLTTVCQCKRTHEMKATQGRQRGYDAALGNSTQTRNRETAGVIKAKRRRLSHLLSGVGRPVELAGKRVADLLDHREEVRQPAGNSTRATNVNEHTHHCGGRIVHMGCAITTSKHPDAEAAATIHKQTHNSKKSSTRTRRG